MTTTTELLRLEATLLLVELLDTIGELLVELFDVTELIEAMDETTRLLDEDTKLLTVLATELIGKGLD